MTAALVVRTRGMVAVSCAAAVRAIPTQAMVTKTARTQGENRLTEEQVAMVFASRHLPWAMPKGLPGQVVTSQGGAGSRKRASLEKAAISGCRLDRRGHRPGIEWAADGP